jgi:hypothetical protein
MALIWQHDKRTEDNKIKLNCVRKLMKNKKIINENKLLKKVHMLKHV